MKKICFFIAAAMIIIVGNAHAANTMNGYEYGRSPFIKAAKIMEKTIRDASEKINIRAIRNFLMSYEDATKVEWSDMNDKGYMCRFLIKGILNRAYYNCNGEWTYTISSYDENNLAKNIRHIVKQVYYDYAISFVNEINLPENKTVYVVQVQNEKALKVLRIADDEMELIEQYQK